MMLAEIMQKKAETYIRLTFYGKYAKLQKPTNCLSVLDHFMGLALKGTVMQII